MALYKNSSRHPNLGLIAIEPPWMFDGAAAADAAPDAGAKARVPDTPAPAADHKALKIGEARAQTPPPLPPRSRRFPKRRRFLPERPPSPNNSSRPGALPPSAFPMTRG